MSAHDPNAPVEVSVVMPCLNEADTLATCIGKAQRALRDAGIDGEIVVADNGSRDGSQAIATAQGARVVDVREPGYGSALLGGIAAARGRFVVMGDADDSYDFLELPKFVAKLREGFELVQGCRLPGGGGTVKPGAMPFLHRWLGNPLFSHLVRKWFKAPVNDVYCGMRGFRRELVPALDLRCAGMEFATEMVIKASLLKRKIAEVPITLHPDGRKAHAPHLKTFRDGWRTLRFFLICSPRRLFLRPGLALMALGALGYALALPGAVIGTVRFDVHTLMFASLFLMCGWQAVLFAVIARTFAFTEGLLPASPPLVALFARVNLEKGLLAALIGVLAGGGLLLAAVNEWRLAAFGDLDYARTLRLVIPGAMLLAIGFQTALGGFLISLLGMRRR